MKRLAHILGYTENKKSNIQLFFMQLFVLTLTMPEHINSWALILMTLFWIFTNDFSSLSVSFRERKLAWYFIGYFLVLLAGLFYTENINLGISDLVLKLSFVIFPFVLLNNKRIDQHMLRGVLRAFYYGTFIVSIVVLLFALKNLNEAGAVNNAQALSFFTYEKLAHTIGIQPIYLSMYMVFSFFCVIWDFFLDPKIGLTKVGDIVAKIWAFHFFMMVILLSSRMELLVLLSVSFLALLYYKGFRQGKWIIALFQFLLLASVTILLLGLFPVNKARYEEMVDISNDYTQTKWGGRSIRLHKWKNTLELISEQPLLGTGAGDMQDELQKVYQRNQFDLAYGYRFNPHNQYLQTWAATGMIGLFFLLAILLISFKYSIQSKNAIYVAFVLIISLSMLTESLLERQKGLVFISFFLLFFGGYYFNHEERLEEHRS